MMKDKSEIEKYIREIVRLEIELDIYKKEHKWAFKMLDNYIGMNFWKRVKFVIWGE